MPGGDAQAAGQRDKNRECRSNRPTIAAQRPAKHIQTRSLTRLHGLATKHPDDVELQCIDGGIAVRGLFSQRLRNNGIQVATNESLRNRRGRAPCGDSAGQRCRLRQQRAQSLKHRSIRSEPRMYASQQLEQQHSESVDIGRCRDRFSGELLRRCAHRRQRRGGGHRQLRSLRIDQLGDAEIEQLHLAFAGDENVRGLQVPMDDQVAMSVGHSFTDLQEKLQPLMQGRLDLRTVGGDRPSFYELHRHEGTPVLSQPPIMQARNARMLQSGQNLAFGEEALRL